MSVILPLPHSTTLTTTASCLSSALLTNEAWYDNESGFCESGVQLASENDNMCGINLLDSCEVATTLARIEDSATDDSDWSDDRASSDDSEQNYHIMNSAPYSYINEINNGNDRYYLGQGITNDAPPSSTSTFSSETESVLPRKRTSSLNWSDSEDSFEVEMDASKVPVHIRTLNLSIEDDSCDTNFYNKNALQKSNVSSTTGHRKSDLIKCKKSKSPRGRPPTFYKSGYREKHESSNIKQGRNRDPKNILLWKFILDELRTPDCTHIQWEDERLGTFKFVDTVECSRRWGQMKNKNCNTMTFEKLSRSIRHYYKDGLMRRNGLRLVYKINWDKVPDEYCPR